PGSGALSPASEKRIHAFDECDELGRTVDGGLDGRFIHSEIEITGSIVLEQHLPQPQADGPVALQSIHVGSRNPAAQMAFDILNVFGLLAVDVARKVKIELVPFDLIETYH